MSLRYREDMPASRGGARRAVQWARTAWALAILFVSLPLAGRIFLGGWTFDGAAGLGCLFGVAGTYLYLRGRRKSQTLPDSAQLLDEAIHLASAGRVEQAFSRLNTAIRLDPDLWQAYQYRGELHLRDPNSLQGAIQDFGEAIRLAPNEPHLYQLREHAQRLAQSDEAAAMTPESTVCPPRETT